VRGRGRSGLRGKLVIECVVCIVHDGDEKRKGDYV